MLIGKQNDKKMKEEKREKMIQENNLVKYYSELAGKLDEIIPCEWERIVLYAEETGDVSAASFYFFTSDSQYYYSENIWEEFGYDDETNDDYPYIENEDVLLNYITLVGIKVPYAEIYGGRSIGLSFDCSWDEENGLGIRLNNEEVIDVGFQDIAI